MLRSTMPFSEAFKLLQIPVKYTLIPEGTDAEKAKAMTADLRNFAKKQYRRLAPKCHPDKFPGNKEKEAEFKLLNAAYSLVANIVVKPKPKRQISLPRGAVGYNIFTGEKIRTGGDDGIDSSLAYQRLIDLLKI